MLKSVIAPLMSPDQIRKERTEVDLGVEVLQNTPGYRAPAKDKPSINVQNHQQLGRGRRVFSNLLLNCK
jgi:hypothetical protein